MMSRKSFIFFLIFILFFAFLFLLHFFRIAVCHCIKAHLSSESEVSVGSCHPVEVSFSAYVSGRKASPGLYSSDNSEFQIQRTCPTELWTKIHVLYPHEVLCRENLSSFCLILWTAPFLQDSFVFSV